ncbi:MAG: protein BatD [Saprospiraceae bacterium]|nr:protein BatD [Saprospiraceae bacterium]
MKYFYLLLILILPLSSQAQQFRFHSQLDAKQIPVGGTFTIQFIIENADAENFTPPNFSPFKVVSGPSQSFRSSFINGKSSKSTSYSYMLQATKAGKFTIPAATLVSKGKTSKSNPVTIEILRSDQVARTDGQPEIMIKAEVDSNHVYIGQQVVIRYKIYTQINIENYNILSESSYAGCFAQALDTYKEPVIKEVVNGKEFSTKVLRKVAVFPQQGGKIEIEPMVVQVGIPSKSRVSRGLLSSFGLERKNLNSNGLTLIARSAYDNSPKNFSGAVGNFSVQFKLAPNQVTTDDAISLVLSITGNGDVKTIRPPSLIFPPGFESFDAKIKEEKMINATDSVRGEKSIEYLIIGHNPGQFEINPSFVYFDPVAAIFRTVSDSFSVTVLQGTGVTNAASDNTLVTEKAVKPISHSLYLTKVRKPVYLRPWYFASYILPVFAFLLFSWRSSRRKTEIKEVDPEAVAKARLEKSKLLMEEANYTLFYEEVAVSLKQFISHKFSIPTSDLSKNKISEVFKQHGLDSHIAQQTLLLLDRCDLALYAGINDASQVNSTYQEAVQLLTSIDEVLD